MQIFLIAFAGLAVLIAAALLSQRTGLAAPLLLVFLGIVASLTPGVPVVELEPEWILAGVLPPLLYASSVRLPVIDLRRNLRMIAWLSIVMVFISAVVIGVVVHLVFREIPLPVAIALGAVVSPTDAVAATSIGKRLNLPPRLMTVLEGESLFNDASALVALRTAVAAIAGTFSFWGAAGSFVWSVVGGIAIGAIVGWLAVALRSRLGDPVLSTTVSFAVPWLAFFPAEEVHASGVISVVIAGIVSGHDGARHLSAIERRTEATNWSTVNFILEHGVFLIMGMQVGVLVESTRATGHLGVVVGATALVLGLAVVLRFVGVGIPVWRHRGLAQRTRRQRERLSLFNERVRAGRESGEADEERLRRIQRRLDQSSADLDFAEAEPIAKRGGLVIAWAGMRGVVTLSAALTIPAMVDGVETPYRDAVVLIAFAVAVLSLVAFGGTLPWLIRRMAFEGPSLPDQQAQMNALMERLLDTVIDQLGPPSTQSVAGEPVAPEIADAVSTRFAPLVVGRPRTEATPPPGAREVAIVLMRRYLTAFREALLDEQAIGAFSTQTYTTATRLLDQEEARLDGGL